MLAPVWMPLCYKRTRVRLQMQEKKQNPEAFFLRRYFSGTKGPLDRQGRGMPGGE